jgi:hypothetical protein
MRGRFVASTIATAAVMVVVSLTQVSGTAGGGAQTPTAEEKTWNAPRTPDGQPDIQGFWANQGRRLSTYNIEEAADERHVLLSGVQTDSASLIVDPADGRIPYQPWARAKRTEVFDNHTNLTKWEHVDPHTRCFLSGVPRVFYQGTFQIVQPRGYVVILQEFNHGSRIIPLDGHPHVGDNIKLWMGDSRGHWEGNTLVVDVTNHNPHTWFDIVGDFHSDALRISERYTFVNADTIGYQATFEDPKVYTRPFKIALTFGRNVGGEAAKRYELMEEACLEGDRDTQEMLKNLLK